MITDDELSFWQELAEKATPGPWTRNGGNPPSISTNANHNSNDFPERRVIIRDNGEILGHFLGVCQGYSNHNDWEGEWNDLAFIAAAREAVPLLIAEIRRLRELIDQVEWIIDHDKSDYLDDKFCLWCHNPQSKGHEQNCPAFEKEADGKH